MAWNRKVHTPTKLNSSDGCLFNRKKLYWRTRKMREYTGVAIKVSFFCWRGSLVSWKLTDLVNGIGMLPLFFLLGATTTFIVAHWRFRRSLEQRAFKRSELNTYSVVYLRGYLKALRYHILRRWRQRKSSIWIWCIIRRPIHWRSGGRILGHRVVVDCLSLGDDSLSLAVRLTVKATWLGVV